MAKPINYTAEYHRAAFEAYILQLGGSVTPWLYRKQFIGYLMPDTQSRWCTWVEAIETERARKDCRGKA